MRFSTGSRSFFRHVSMDMCGRLKRQMYFFLWVSVSKTFERALFSYSTAAMLVTSVCLGWRSVFPFLLHDLKSGLAESPFSHVSPRPSVIRHTSLILLPVRGYKPELSIWSWKTYTPVFISQKPCDLSKSFNIPKSFWVPEPWFSTCNLKDQPRLLHRVIVRMKYNMHFVRCRTLPGIHSLYSFNALLYFVINYWVIFGLLIVF